MADDAIPQTCQIVTLAQAIELGLKRYFTGLPCGRGHTSERSTKWRACLECQRAKHKEWLSANQDKTKAYKYKSYHKDIAASRSKLRDRRNANPDLFKKYKKNDYEKHRKKRIAAIEKRRLANPELIREERARWRAKNRAKSRSIARRWATKNKEAMRSWRESNPDKIRIYASVSKSRRRIRIKEGGGTFTKSDIDRIFKAQKGKCAYCRTGLKYGYHIDHIESLAKGGSNFPRNLQLCCDDCNYKKNARDPIEFAQSRGLLI